MHDNQGFVNGYKGIIYGILHDREQLQRSRSVAFMFLWRYFLGCLCIGRLKNYFGIDEIKRQKKRIINYIHNGFK